MQRPVLEKIKVNNKNKHKIFIVFSRCSPTVDAEATIAKIPLKRTKETMIDKGMCFQCLLK